MLVGKRLGLGFRLPLVMMGSIESLQHNLSYQPRLLPPQYYRKPLKIDAYANVSRAHCPGR